MIGLSETGKMYVVKVFIKVIKAYGVSYKLRFLAPTGSTASLIDGMIIHKGFGIRVESAHHNKRKSNCAPGLQEEDFLILVSISNLSELWKEWKDVEIVFIDETSLLNEQLLGDIDYVLHYAKENFEEHFRGMSIFFSGDFYQFPPVAGTALWVPIPTTLHTKNTEIQKHLGQIAWKSDNTIINFHKQQHMKDDQEYADAVFHFQTYSYTLDDVDFFNNRLIQYQNYPNGIDFGTNKHLSGVIIVNTNHIQEEFNSHKCKSNAEMKNKDLVICFAHDVNCNTNKAAIVHFLLSKVKLNGLSTEYFLIEPISWLFTTLMNTNGNLTLI